MKRIDDLKAQFEETRGRFDTVYDTLEELQP